MFESLTERLQDTFKKLRGKGKLSESDIEAALREVRLALLEADVNYKVVKKFTADIKTRAVGQEVMRSLTPAQQVIKIVNEEMVNLMGSEVIKLTTSSDGPTIYLLAGLQGSGKTTAAGKLAKKFTRDGRNPLLVAADIYRPAAVNQLEILGESINVSVFSMGTDTSPVKICQAAVKHAIKNGNDPIIIDTAGRLHIDEQLMDEIKDIKKQINPTEILFVADAMTGQDAVTVAKEFNDSLDVDGIVLTKMDGDARGGAALSIKSVIGKPIKLVGVGEKLDALEEFHPDRMASRILGMGDVLTLIEKAESAIDEEKAREWEKKITEKRGLTFDDFLDQLQQIKNMGSLDQIVDMIPGMSGSNLQVDEEQLKRTEAIIKSMTIHERNNPRIINGSRRTRISKGSGTTIHDVNRLLKQFTQMNKMMRQLTDTGKGKKKKRRLKRNFPFSF
ncbi:signal recognition particle protein [Candidatus Poribacteria bacterium]|nr:signal recognition particle protein [Candidatus Poribacteria bacterium]